VVGSVFVIPNAASCSAKDLLPAPGPNDLVATDFENAPDEPATTVGALTALVEVYRANNEIILIERLVHRIYDD
jgi:hypothetical protein